MVQISRFVSLFLVSILHLTRILKKKTEFSSRVFFNNLRYTDTAYVAKLSGINCLYFEKGSMTSATVN